MKIAKVCATPSSSVPAQEDANTLPLPVHLQRELAKAKTKAGERMDGERASI